MATSFKCDYDSENDILLIAKAGQKSSGSVEIGGDIILDFFKNEVVSIEFMDASKIIKSIAGDQANISKSLLENISSCKFAVENQRNLMVVKVLIKMDDSKISVPVTVPRYLTHSPVLA